MSDAAILVQALEPAALLVPLVWLSVVDLRRRVIPNACVVAIVGIHLLCAMGGLLLGGSSLWYAGLSLLLCALNAIIVGVVMVAFAWLASHLFGQAGIGGGDIKLICAMAFCAGWRLCLVAVAGACVLGLGFWAIRRVTAKKADARMTSDRFPVNSFAWGPWLSLAFLLVMAYGDHIFMLL